MKKDRRLVKTPGVPDRLGWRDYFQMTTTGLMLILGGYILWQTVFVRWALPSFLFSTALVLFATFRIRMIWSYFREKREQHGI